MLLSVRILSFRPAFILLSSCFRLCYRSPQNMNKKPHHSTSLYAYLLLMASNIVRAGKPATVTWQSPSDGDLYVSGDTITASW